MNAIIADASSPDHTDFSRKDAVVYLFENIHAGNYRFDIRQSFKSGRENCQSVVGLTVKTWEEGRALNGLDKLSFGTMHLYQSASEQNARPRHADRLPMDLGTYKFLGG